MKQNIILSVASILLSANSLLHVLSCFKSVSSFSHGNRILYNMGQSRYSTRHFQQRLKMAEEDLTNDEISRYSRHLVLSDVGMNGQKALKNASVLVIGAGEGSLRNTYFIGEIRMKFTLFSFHLSPEGGLGSPCLLYLAAAGVGHIGIVVSSIEKNNHFDSFRLS